jgi:hypothetical protein
MKKLFIIFAVLCLAAPAMAADWNFYGSARMATFVVDVDPDVPGVDSDTDLQWAQQGNSRIGATVKFNDEIGGGFEMSDSFGKRKLYGTYAFGNGGQLLIGQTYAPSAIFGSNSVYDGDGDLLGIGEFYEGRVPMIQFSMAGFKVALISPSLGGYDETDAVVDYFDADGTDATVGTGSGTTYAFEVDAAEGYDVDSTLPKIEVAYTFKADMFSVTGFAGYQTYTLDGAQDYDIDSMVYGLGAGLNFGPLFVNLGVHAGTNLGNYGAYQPYLDDGAALGATDTLDNDGLGYLAVVGFNASDMLTIEAGYGHEESELDNSNNKQEADQYYVNATINITKGFFIVPEIGMQTFKEDASTEEPEVFYWGAKWQINF